MGTSGTQHQLYVHYGQLTKRFLQVRKRTEDLCQALSDEDCSLSVNEETSPVKWHLAHSSWFFERYVLLKFKRGYQSYRPEFDFLFNSYYRRIGSFLPKSKRGVLSRPSRDEIIQYRHFITESIMGLMESMNPADEGKLLHVLELGVNHEEQHQELLLMDIKRCFFENPLRPHYHTLAYPTGETVSSQWKSFHEGAVKIGIPKDYQSFSFDNEKDQHKVWLESFDLSSHLVTNEEYIAFIDEGGYDNPRFWLSDGWDIKEKEKWEHPLYWEKQGQNWWTMTLLGMVPIEPSSPVVHVSFYEAMAYARWKGVRLPSEGEWETAARLEKTTGPFLESGLMEPAPPSGTHQFFSQIHGTVWEWTQSPYLSYPRFKPQTLGMSEFSEKFMCNQFVLRGGSCVTPATHYRVTYRNFYYPQMRWMYSGIRLARDHF